MTTELSELKGHISINLFADLQRLKESLMQLKADEVDPREARTLSSELSAVRLQLHRLAGDRTLPDLEERRRELHGLDD